MRALIVGPGYIGQQLGLELVRQGHDVFGLRRSANASHDLQGTRIRPMAADITDPSSLAALPQPHFDWVVNCVSSSHGGADDYRKVYLQGARNLIDWLSPHPPAKFVYTSSTGVYGQNDGSLVDETAITEPVTETSRILAETERAFLIAARDQKMPAVVLRVAGIYGPGRTWWVKQLLAGEARIDGDGRRTLNMIHRDDVVGCVTAALERGKPGEVYNAVDDKPVAQLEFLTWLAERLNCPQPPSTAENAEGNRKRGITDKRISNRKLREQLGYQFIYPTYREGYAAVIK